MCLDVNTRFLMRLIIDISLLTSVYCVALVILPQVMKTHERGFFCGDESLMYPYKQYTILKRLHLTLLAIAVPFALVLCVEMLRVAFPPHKATSNASSFVAKPPRRQEFVGISIPTFVIECYNIMGLYLFGLALVIIVTTLCQRSTGRLAPYFFEVCQPLLPSNETACAAHAHFGHYIEEYSCGSMTSSTPLLSAMRQSFPSGQVSTTAYSMCYMAIYLQARLHSGWLILWRTLLQFSALLISLWVSFERLMAYRHHWTDVLVGLIIGYTFALFITQLVAQLIKKVPLRVLRRVREDTQTIYGYYTVMPRPRYY